MQLGTIGKRNVARSEASRSGSLARYGNAVYAGEPGYMACLFTVLPGSDKMPDSLPPAR